MLTVEFPRLGKNDVIVPGTSRLSFKVNLSSTGENADANRTIVNNLGRAIINKLEVELEGQSVFTLDDADMSMCYISGKRLKKEKMPCIKASRQKLSRRSESELETLEPR